MKVFILLIYRIHVTMSGICPIEGVLNKIIKYFPIIAVFAYKLGFHKKVLLIFFLNFKLCKEF